MDRGEEQLVELVNAWAAYRQTHVEATLADFCLHYLTSRATIDREGLRHQHAITDDNALKGFTADTFTAEGVPLMNKQWVESLTGQAGKSMVAIRPEARLGALVGRMAKYAYHYSKKAMLPLEFRSIEDPVYLIVIVQMGMPKKSELIYEMMAEFASGIDVINRLIKMELVEEFPDEQDRRSKRVRITPKGLEVIGQTLPVMDRVADIAYSSLTEGEKAILVGIFDKLDRYHAEHFRQSRNASFDEVYRGMVGGEKP
jgi:DNA-binding MarR family transcriptional regulator